MDAVPNRAGHSNRSDLYGLLAEAKKHDNFESFEKAYFQGLKGRYYHLTDNSNFNINLKTGPRDTVSTGISTPDVGALMVTSDPTDWDSEYNDEGNHVTRPFTAVINLSNAPKGSYYSTTRGYGQETYVSPEGVKHAKVDVVLTREQALADFAKHRKTAPQNRQELQAIYESVKRGN
jgi:hypothetical protein